MEGSLDPRVRRLPQIHQLVPKAPLDQFGTYEVFVQPREGKPFAHEGCVHAPNVEMAFVLAKEAFTRRFTCVSLFVADTRRVFVSAMLEGSDNVYDSLKNETESTANEEKFEIFHLYKRGKQHQHYGSVTAQNPLNAILRTQQSNPPT